jgi:hypothetical protein
MSSKLPFEQRACFIAGQAKSGTTLLVALLDNHPELLVLPEETAHFPTVLTKYAPRGRRAQFDYLTKQSLSNVLFGGPCKWGKRNYATFPRQKFLEAFERLAFDPANAQEDLLVLMVKAYAATLERPLDSSGGGWKKLRPIAITFQRFCGVFRTRKFSSLCATRVPSLRRKSLWRKQGKREGSQFIT